jgi:hypothetical protein
VLWRTDPWSVRCGIPAILAIEISLEPPWYLGGSSVKLSGMGTRIFVLPIMNAVARSREADHGTFITKPFPSCRTVWDLLFAANQYYLPSAKQLVGSLRVRYS